MIAFVGGIFGLTSARATPIVDDFSTGPAKWKHAITVYIPLDPERNNPDAPRNRQGKIKDAVDQWKAVAGPNVPAINTVMLDADGHDPSTGKAPDPKAEGTVMVEWVTAGAKKGEAKPMIVGDNTGQQTADKEDIIKNQVVVGETIQIDRAVTALENQDNALAFSTMLHEFGHALQLDHTAETDSVMQKNLESYQELTKPGASDLRELGSLYTAFNGHLDGSAIQLASGLWDYSYTATWLSGGEIPLFQIVSLGSIIENVTLPAGWELADFPANNAPNILSFRVAPTDALQAYLNASNPSISVSFESFSPPGVTDAWLGTDFSMVGPQPVPEVGTPLVGFALLGAGVVERFRRRRLAKLHQ